MLGATGAVLGGLVLLHAATPTFWVVSTQADFLKGEADGLAIDNLGRLTLGPAVSLVAESAAPALWTILPAAGGGYWIGSGNDGQVLRVGTDGRLATAFDSPEMEVHALAPAPGGGVYAATSPDGKIYRVAADGTSTVFFDPDDKYIWSLAVGADGVVYAGTGEKGLIYRITPDGKGERFYDTRSTNVVALAFDREGRLLAGTSNPGRLFRIDGTGKGFVLLDSPFKEIHSLRVDASGTIYATAVDGEAPETSPPGGPTSAPKSPTPTASVSTDIVTFTVVGTSGQSGSSAGASTSKSTSSNPKGAVYRIAPDGVWETVWESADDTPYDIVPDAPGGLLVGTGPKGKIFQVGADPAHVTLVGRAAAQQITRMVRDARGELVFVTSNPGKVFRLAATPGPQGTYLSDVRDAETVATWGVIRWRANGGGAVAVSTRSGNTSTPDDTWSDWSAAYRDASGDAITSPKARYLQWRAVLSAAGGGAGPVLTSVSAAYLPRNRRPEVTSITVHPAGTVFQRPFPTGETVELAGFDSTPVDGRPGIGPATSGPQPTLGRKLYQKGLQTFAWTAADEDDDTLQYDVYYRRDDETDWKALKRGLWEPILVWDTTSVPDGAYTIKVVASDAPSNAPDAALDGEAESDSFEIDNTPPRIEVGAARHEGGRTILPFTVRDDRSAVNRVEFSVDAEQWKTIYPKDGIPDSRVEQFELVLDGNVAAANVIIRATDAMNNIATATGRR